MPNKVSPAHSYLVECVEGMVSFYDLTEMEWVHFSPRNVLITVPLRLQTCRVRRSMGVFEEVTGLVGMGYLHKIQMRTPFATSEYRLWLSPSPTPEDTP